MDESSMQLALRPYLLDGEHILWTGQPDPRRLLSASDVFVIPFSLVWGGFALFWEVAALGIVAGTGAAPTALFALWGVPFLVIGQYFIWGRFVYKRWDRKRTIYAVTTQRVMVLRGSNLQSVFVKQMPQMSQTVRADGSGSIEFDSSPHGYAFWANTGMDFFARRGAAGNVVALYDIPDVNAAARAISAATTQPAGFAD